MRRRPARPTCWWVTCLRRKKSGRSPSRPTRLADLQWETRRWNGSQAYADSKLHDALLAVEGGNRTDGYFYHHERYEPAAAAGDPEIQDRLVTACAELTGTPLPR